MISSSETNFVTELKPSLIVPILTVQDSSLAFKVVFVTVLAMAPVRLDTRTAM